MSIATVAGPKLANVADLLRHLGDIPPERVRLKPAPGHATEADVLLFTDRKIALCELIFGTLVEKPMGCPEALLAAELMLLLGMFSRSLGKLGHVYGPDTLIRLAPDVIREPDISFFKWDRYPNGKRPNTQILDVIPNLAVEVLSPSNTLAEMAKKRKEYFTAGVELVWMIDIEVRTVEVFMGVDSSILLTGNDTLTGGDVLPGFAVALPDLFACLDEQAPPKP